MRTPNSGSAMGCILLTSLLSSMGAHAAATDTKYPVKAQRVSVVADTQAGARRQGTVNVGGINWACSGARCSASTMSSAVVASLAACQGLAREVGAIRSFTLANRPLNGKQLQQCNSVVLTGVNQKASPYPENWTEPDLRAGKSSAFEDMGNELRKNPQTTFPPAKMKVPTAPDSSGYPVRIRAEGLSVTGTGGTEVRLPVTSTRIRTESLSVTGTGGAEVRLPVTSIRIRTESLTVTGTGSDH